MFQLFSLSDPLPISESLRVASIGPQGKVTLVADDTPWSRLQSASGRATRVPHLLEAIFDPGCAGASAELRDLLVCPEIGVSPAAPHAVTRLAERLPGCQPEIAERVLEVISETLRAATLAMGPSAERLEPPDAFALAAPTNLLPPFVSLDEDEDFFEETFQESHAQWERYQLDTIWTVDLLRPFLAEMEVPAAVSIVRELARWRSRVLGR